MSDSAAGTPQQMEMVPLADRLRWMLVVRFAVVVLPIAAWLATGDQGDSSPAVLVAPGAVLLGTGLVLHLLSGRGRRWAVAAITLPVILDGGYLGGALYLTQGTAGPVVYVIALHVLAVTLLGSFRTGLKLAFWHSLVVMSVLEAVSTGVLPGEGPGLEFDKLRYSIFLTAVWTTAVTTAVLAAVNERELRPRRYDEAALRRLAAALHEAETGTEVVEALLDFAVDAADASVAGVHCRLVGDEGTASMSLVARIRQGGAMEVLRTAAEPGPGSLVDVAASRGSTVLRRCGRRTRGWTRCWTVRPASWRCPSGSTGRAAGSSPSRTTRARAPGSSSAGSASWSRRSRTRRRRWPAWCCWSTSSRARSPTASPAWPTAGPSTRPWAGRWPSRPGPARPWP